MNASVWRWTMLPIIGAFLAFVLASPWIEVPRGVYGYRAQMSTAGKLIVTAVSPDSSAFAAGLRSGMVVTRLAASTAELVRSQDPLPGTHERIRLPDGRVATVVARGGGTLNGIDPITELLRCAFLIIAGLLAFCRPADIAVRWLSIFLACFGVGIAMSNNAFSSLAGSALLNVGSTIFVIGGTAAAAAFAATFPDNRPGPRARVLLRICLTWSIAAIGLTAVYNFSPGALNGPLWLRAIVSIFLPCAFLFSAASAVGMLIAGYRPANGVERQRRLWILAVIGTGLILPIASIGISAFYRYTPWLDQLSLVGLATIPIGFAYVILRHRVIDVGFVINRAVVYTALSAIVVGVFVIVETLLGKYVEATSHVTSIAVQLLVALVLGFSIRFIHERVDRLVDRVLFRRHHEAEAALRDLTHDASYITDEQILVDRCADAVTTFGEAGACGIWLRDGTSYRPAGGSLPATVVGENDPAVVAMRARRVVIEPPRLHSALPGAIAFPMTVRGELVGVLACDPKRDGTRYAPDEREALAALAAAVGHAYDGLEVRRLREQLARLAPAAFAATGGAMGTF